MANSQEVQAAEGQTPSSKKSAIGWLLVGAVSGGLGVAAPLMLKAEPEEKQTKTPAVNVEMVTADKIAFVPFGDVTVNLNEGRMNRYLRLKISLQIDKAQDAIVKQAVDKQGLILRNWLLSHLSDKELDEIRGAAGQNMLRREIRDQFNSVLFPDGYDRIYDVLFEEFNVQ